VLLLLSFACAPPPEAKPADTDETPAVEAPAPAFTPLDDGLGATSEAALARTPAWLKGDLALALAGVGSERREELASLLVELDDPALLDEVAFGIAALSPGVLKADNFHPQLLVENARGLYEADPYLDYVELVDVGDPEVDADWYTTTRYRVEVDGKVVEQEIDRELYYWFVVHPRIEDENPWYIDAWAECTRSGLECAASPEEGWFWRDFLWAGAEERCPDGEVCPIVPDYLSGLDRLWGAADGLDAVHAVAGMMLDSPDETGRWLSFGAYGERSIQPVRIYALGRGNCGEWADMTTAISRTALIPNVNVTPSSWDHTWNAVWAERWIAWEPVNWWFDHPYGSGYTTWATRGDASMWYQTEQYNSNNATLDIRVLDDEGVPVDGAAVVLWSPYDTSWWYAGELVTDLTGTARFTVGADKEFAFLVTSDLGEYPAGGGSIDYATRGIEAGGTETTEVRLSGRMPTRPEVGLVDAGGDTPLVVDVVAEGRVSGKSYRMGDRSSQPTDAPPLDVWVLTEEGFDAFQAGEPFEALDGELAADGTYVVVVANLAATSVSAVGTVSMRFGEAAWSSTLALAPGEHLAVALAPTAE